MRKRQLLISSPLILLFTACSTLSGGRPMPANMYELKNPPLWGTTQDGKEIFAGGFSGLIYLGKNEKNGEMRFMTTTDRGPNAEPDGNNRPFYLPSFTPRLVMIETNKSDQSINVVQEILLTDPAGAPLLGLPQSLSQDERAVDIKGGALGTSDMGIDPECLAQDDQGNFWLGEEYRPSLLKFNPNGKLLKRYIPKGSMELSQIEKINSRYGASVIEEALPESLKRRTVNRGFEGCAIREGLIYAFMQSPLKSEKKDIRIIEFSPKKARTLRELHYPLEKKKRDKIGDLSLLANGNFITVEQNGDEHVITEFELPDEGSKLHPVIKLDLHSVGYDFAEKIEGLAFITEGKESFYAVINDNDFGVIQSHKTILGIFRLNSSGNSTK